MSSNYRSSYLRVTIGYYSQLGFEYIDSKLSSKLEISFEINMIKD